MTLERPNVREYGVIHHEDDAMHYVHHSIRLIGQYEVNKLVHRS